ncbi:MAG: peptidoglycan DD-metalloendopeptidase family protein [Candidatus Paceibacterota bacterium]|nr:peptidoglycan DD-metalloendopeptidase family protein [Candidatus Paceibacterota bacterium]
MIPLHFIHRINGKSRQKNSFSLLLSLLFLGCTAIGVRTTGAETTDITDTQAVSISSEPASIDTTYTIPEEETQNLRNKINQKNSELEDLKKKIETYEKQLDYTQTQTKTLQNTVKTLDLERQKMNTSIQLTQKRLETSSLNLTQLNLGIADTEEKTVLVSKALSEILRTIDQADDQTILETFLSNGKLSDIMDESMQLMQLREEVRGHMKELGEYQSSLVAQKSKVENEKNKLTNYKSTLSDQKSVLDNAKKEKADLLALTKNRESDYQKILNINKAKAEEFEKELFEYESKLTRQLDRKFIPEVGSKILVWPLDKIIITQHFGKTKDSLRLYASGTHNGMDFAANRGTPVKSPAKGEVIATGNTDLTCAKASYGKWILIRHNNGLSTLFGHFDTIKVSAGQDVEVGDLIGYSGNTGYSTGPHVHLTVFASDGVQVGSFASNACPGKTFTMPLPTAKNAYLDPEAYLPS